MSCSCWLVTVQGQAVGQRAVIQFEFSAGAGGTCITGQHTPGSQATTQGLCLAVMCSEHVACLTLFCSNVLSTCRCKLTSMTPSQKVPLTKKRNSSTAASSNHTSSSRTHSCRGEQQWQYTTASHRGCWGWCLQMGLLRCSVQQGQGSCRRSWCSGGGCAQQRLGEWA